MKAGGYDLVRLRRAPIVAAELVLIALAYWAAFELRFEFSLPIDAWDALIHSVPWLVAIRGLTFIPFGVNEGLWKYTSFYDLKMLMAAIATSSLIFAIFLWSPFGPALKSGSILVIDALIITACLGGIRVARRIVAEFGGRAQPDHRRLLIYGAGDAGQMILREMRKGGPLAYDPVGFIDDDATKVGRRIHGVPVLGTRRDLAGVMARLNPAEILLALPSVPAKTTREILKALEPYQLPIKTLPAVREIIEGDARIEQIRTLNIEDLLARPVIGLDREPLRLLIQGKTVMVTGAGGSIGSELCRQIFELRPSALVLFDRYENTLEAIRLELRDTNREARSLDSTPVYAVVGDVTDASVVKATLAQFQPDLVFHAAAHKHVPLMEENPAEAVKNNVRGTRILIESAVDAGVKRFVMISTDKAANPSSVMGASKRLAELVVQAAAVNTGTTFSIVRFGNVLGSNGSVVPRFLGQIRQGGPVTVTHPDVRRFFMLIPEAVHLVLHAAALPESGATLVLDMGEQIKVVEMARHLIRLSGKTPDQDIQITFTGLRPGEKMEEELIGAGEEIKPSSVPKVFVVQGSIAPPAGLLDRIRALEAAADARDVAAVLRMLRDLSSLRYASESPNATTP